jgi:hypothetical protein
MLTPRFLAASVLALGLAAGPAVGQDDTRFARFDDDRDGRLTRFEVARLPGLALKFEQFDADKDGKLDRAEFAAAIAALK